MGVIGLCRRWGGYGLAWEEKRGEIGIALDHYAEAGETERVVKIGDRAYAKGDIKTAIRAYNVAEDFDKLNFALKKAKKGDISEFMAAFHTSDRARLKKIIINL